MDSKKFFQKVFLNKWSYKLLSPFIYVANRLQASKTNFEESAEQEQLYTSATELFKDKKILIGPFKGLHFNAGNTGASSNFAKMLGSYESEIHPFIETALKNNYTNLINIGSDDGYYAIGFAARIPELKIYVFDTNKVAWHSLQQNAVANGVGERILQSGLFSINDLKVFADGQRNLFVVDCEGAEKEIFTRANIIGLLNSDLIIELHLHIHPELDVYFKNLFSETHTLEFKDSVPDYLKASKNNYPELSQASFALKKYITGEREVFMQWLFLRSKLHLNETK
jgi:hypothetical protein